MRRRIIQSFISVTAIITMTAALSFPALAGAKNNGVNGGQFTNLDNLTWTANDGTDTTYGRGSKFSDLHPEITDPEYYLKEKVRYPGEGGNAVSVYNSKGEPKAEYDAASVEKAREFLNSFDWIHSDELTRAKMVHDRVSNGFSGNVYAVADPKLAYPVLASGKGVCMDFSNAFEALARYVGLECVTYEPAFLHQACLVKISGQWFAIDPTVPEPFFSNDKTHPVDFDTEYHRWEKQSKAEREVEYAANPDSLVAQLDAMDKKEAAGIITDADYEKINPLISENDAQLMAGTITPEQYEARYVEILKSLGK